MRTLTRNLLIVGGTISVVLALVGIVVPLLPTTPFLLLAAACYARSSDRFHRWLLSNRLFGSYIRNYREGRGMPAREKAVTLVLLWLTILVTAILFLEVWWGRLILLAVAAVVTSHILRIKTARPGSNPVSPPPDGDSFYSQRDQT